MAVSPSHPLTPYLSPRLPEKAAVDAQVAEQSKVIERAQKSAFELQASLTKKVQELEQAAGQFNNTATELQMVPHTAKNGELVV